MPGMNEYTYNGTELEVSDQMRTDFDRDGFIIVRSLLDKHELALIEESVTGPGSLTSYAYGRDDGQGKLAKMCLWHNPGIDTTGALAKTRKLAKTAEELIGGPVYHYHSKLMMKDAYSGGSFVWHQDYGYWYNNASLFPDMLTAFIAVDRCGRDNGCLQVLRGSHRCGRIEHGVVGDQTGADVSRVAELEKRLDRLHVELQPGDTLFFHCNLLHTSSQNLSEHRRWAILSCYNRVSNKPFKKMLHAVYSDSIDFLDNDAVIKTGVSRDLTGKEVLEQVNGEYVFRFA